MGMAAGVGLAWPRHGPGRWLVCWAACMAQVGMAQARAWVLGLCGYWWLAWLVSGRVEAWVVGLSNLVSDRVKALVIGLSRLVMAWLAAWLWVTKLEILAHTQYSTNTVFAYSIVSNYYMASLITVSFVCWIWKGSVKAQIIGSGSHGLGIGSFSLDWMSITGYIGSPMAYPRFAIVNKLVGFVAMMYLIAPIAYWTNLFNAKRFPFFSLNMYDYDGKFYKAASVFGDDLVLDPQAYHNYSDIYLSIFSAMGTGFGFAGLTATLTHFFLFYGRDAWVYGDQIQLPTWGFLVAVLVAAILLLPVGAIKATTGINLSMFLIGEMIMGYASPGKPIANMAFVAYSQSTKLHALNFIAEFKLGHYMKISPRSMFLVQIVGALLASTTRIFTAWWALTSIKNICVPEEGNIWTCPAVTNSYNRALIWGGIGPSRVFAPHGQYAWLYIFFLIGVVGPVMVWILSRKYPQKKWIRLINFPIIFAGTAMMPPMGAAHIWSFFIVAFIFNFLVYSRHKGWWSKHAYDLSNGLDLGTAIFGVLYMTLALQDIYEVQWIGGADEQCPLSLCPTAPGVIKKNCPVFN
ncbi:oligopeptide transporter 5-like [Juglans microcarpa x Juglans regia]|uniref:oligopeptide transporter 5-like n=1 Tax=Juglans microcarpa x Juglans regia TaxID=2249226 RepID=UPI001B7DB243|nr:oligopeptide transporter 5-like [Juglans microcarpa x Juglans regia]